ncbi:MAG: MerR family transcriptional regulator [Actinomycetota bacterium]
MGASPLTRIGELADATGVTVRTLRYYEEIGLLTPAGRTDAGHRLYGAAEVERLYRICLLRQLGLPLDGVRASLEDDGVGLGDVITDHLRTLDARLAAENRLRARLARLVGALSVDPQPTDELIDVLEDMHMLDTNLDRPIASLVYADLDAAYEFLTTAFGLGPGELFRDGDGNVVHGEIDVGGGTIWLHPESARWGLASPATLGGSASSMVVLVDDVDAHHAHAASSGAEIRYAPVDQDYGYREYGVVDSEGHLWSFMKALGD